MKPFARLRELLEKATPAPWTGTINYPFYATLNKPASSLSIDDEPSSHHYKIEDIELILEMRNKLSKLLEALDLSRNAIKISEGYVYMLCQPDKGDLFSEYDDKILKILKKINELGGA